MKAGMAPGSTAAMKRDRYYHKLMTDHRITEFPQEICEKPELHKVMKKALIHESQPNLIKRIYHVVFRKNYIGQA